MQPRRRRAAGASGSEKALTPPPPRFINITVPVLTLEPVFEPWELGGSCLGEREVIVGAPAEVPREWYPLPMEIGRVLSDLVEAQPRLFIPGQWKGASWYFLACPSPLCAVQLRLDPHNPRPWIGVVLGKREGKVAAFRGNLCPCMPHALHEKFRGVLLDSKGRGS